MSDIAKKEPKVDEAGIRLAPAPMKGSDAGRVKPVVQEFVIVPRLEYKDDEPRHAALETTASDYQPADRDAGRRWKRLVRTRNFISSVIMIVACALVLLPFALAAADVAVDFLPFKFVPERFNVITGWIDAFRSTIDLGWTGEGVKDIWLGMVPDMLLTVGLIAVVINLVKAVTGLFGAIKPRRYTAGAVVFLLSVAAVFIAALVGAENIGIAQIDFMEDFIRGWQTSEFFTLFAVAVANVILAVVCTFITPLRTGYTRTHI